MIDGAPPWAQSGDKQRPSDGPARPDSAALGAFATAAAKRYGGDFSGLPRVRYWQVWNEPNLSIQLMPQHEGDRVISPRVYRAMVNAMAQAVHSVHHDNVVGGSVYRTGKSMLIWRKLLILDRTVYS